MAKPTTTGTTAIKIAKPKYILVQPWESATAKGAGTVYSLSDVLRDSTSISTADPNTSNIENELSDTPIRQNVTLGETTFSTTLEDIQANVLKDICGFSADTTSGKLYAPKSYTDKFAEITIVLDQGAENYYAIVLPKVQLNSKLILESLSSSMLGVQIAGTCLVTEVTDGDNTYECFRYHNPAYTLPT